MDNDIQERLDNLFGSYKAEWLKNDLFKFFTEPYYFTALKSNAPGVLQGGRGTGKTTVLRGLSYIGQYEILKSKINDFDKNKFIGIYYRANTNHVRAFSDKGISEETWIPIFQHYFNLIISWEMLNFIDWHKQEQPMDSELSSHTCKLIASSLCISDSPANLSELLQFVETTMYQFQAKINNISDCHFSNLSTAGVPIEIIARETQKLSQFKGKIYYLLIDEYENFTDYQQKCINTLLKHVPDFYTIKIGVREMGWRVKTTLNDMESLNDPADYRLTKIEEIFTDSTTSNLFEEFASNVCNLRLRKLMGNKNKEYDIRDALTSISVEEEAERLNVSKSSLYNSFIALEENKCIRITIPKLYKFFIAYWATIHSHSLYETIQDYQKNIDKWNDRYENYKYDLLFKINKGKYQKITKYYAGWNTFIKLSNGNIRYLMSLVYQSYSIHNESGNNLEDCVSIESQTRAAKMVGWKNLTELEGSCMKGIQLTQLVQSLGTIFKHLARDGEKTAPEINQFEITDNQSQEVREILKLGVMNLALVRMPSNKLSGERGIKEFQYQLHPIFSPYFDYSYRKKRKISLINSDILGCINNSNKTVQYILKRRRVILNEDSVVPTQLTLFDINMLGY